MNHFLSVLIVIVSIMASNSGLAQYVPPPDTTPPVGRIITSETGNEYPFRFATKFTPAVVQDVEVWAEDNRSGVAAVYVQIILRGPQFTEIPNRYWNGQSFQLTGVWQRAQFDGLVWVVPDVDFSVEDRYLIKAVIADVAGNVSTNIGVKDMYISSRAPNNVSDPQADLIYPTPFWEVLPSGETRGDMTVHEATKIKVSVETWSPFVIDKVFVQIRHDQTFTYWNGVSWQSAPAWVSCTPFRSETTSGRWDSDNEVDFAMAGTYQVRTHVRDFGGNSQLAIEGSKATLVIEPDATDPSIGFNGFTPYYFKHYPDGTVDEFRRRIRPSNFSLDGYVTDNGRGIKRVYIQIRRVKVREEEKNYWNGGTWQSAPIWLPTYFIELSNSSNNLYRPRTRWLMFDTIDFTEKGIYRVALKGFDNAGNVATPSENPILEMYVW